MTLVLERLHGSTPEPTVTLRNSLPGPITDALSAACVTDDHLAGLVAWLAGGGFVVTLAGALHSWAGASCAAVVLILVPAGAIARRRGERQRRIIAALAEFIDSLGRSLRSGATFSQSLAEGALEAPQELAEELDSVIEAIRRGQSVPDALASWVDRWPRSQVRLVSATLALASENESGAVQALGGVAQSLRDRDALAGEVRALTSQATTSLRALVLLPIGFLSIDVAAGQGSIAFLLRTELGRVCLGAGIVLNLLGWIWMRKLIDRQVRT